jgi:hypothetical protein
MADGRNLRSPRIMPESYEKEWGEGLGRELRLKGGASALTGLASGLLSECLSVLSGAFKG